MIRKIHDTIRLRVNQIIYNIGIKFIEIINWTILFCTLEKISGSIRFAEKTCYCIVYIPSIRTRKILRKISRSRHSNNLIQFHDISLRWTTCIMIASLIQCILQYQMSSCRSPYQINTVLIEVIAFPMLVYPLKCAINLPIHYTNSSKVWCRNRIIERYNSCSFLKQTLRNIQIRFLISSDPSSTMH